MLTHACWVLAGSGSIFESLRLGRPLVVVPNPLLMDNHQVGWGGDEMCRRHGAHAPECTPKNLGVCLWYRMPSHVGLVFSLLGIICLAPELGGIHNQETLHPSTVRPAFPGRRGSPPGCPLHQHFPAVRESALVPALGAPTVPALGRR